MNNVGVYHLYHRYKWYTPTLYIIHYARTDDVLFFVNARAYGADRNTVVSLHLHVVINVEQMFVYIFYDAPDLDHALRSQFVYIRLKSFLRAIDPHPLKKVSHTSPFSYLFSSKVWNSSIHYIYKWQKIWMILGKKSTF